MAARQMHFAWGELETGLGVQVSIVRLSGTPFAQAAASGRTSTAPTLSSFAFIGGSVPIASSFAIEVRGVAGWVMIPAGGLVSGQREVAFDGPWIGALLGSGFGD
jgi:hypothetical protein